MKAQDPDFEKSCTSTTALVNDLIKTVLMSDILCGASGE
jgi:hypothetical protein